jgi:hypothetical protein
MRHEDRPQTIPETVHAAPFPVYGLTNHPFDLSLVSHGLGISPLGNLIHVSLAFTSPRYSDPSLSSSSSQKSENFQLISVDAAAQRPEREQMVFGLEDSSGGQFFNDETGVLRHHQFSEEEQKKAGSPLIQEKTLPLGDVVFSGKMLHWEQPVQVSAFLLKSEKTILIGNAYGPSYEELDQLLKGLQIINHQDYLLKQYQHEFENPDE